VRSVGDPELLWRAVAEPAGVLLPALEVLVSYDLATYDPDADFDGWYTDTTGQRIRARLDAYGARHVLEVGCATGRMTALLASRDRRVVAIDRSEEMLGVARGRGLPLVSWRRDDLNVLEAEGLRFEAIVCTLLLHEIADPGHMLRWFSRLLYGHRGRVFVTVPNADSVHLQGDTEISERGERFGVRRLLSIGDWHTLLITGTGLRVVTRDEFMLKPYPNAAMATLDGRVLGHLARYVGPGGALCFFELEAD
jgi:SAM-dependent methyltransferase